MDGISDFTVYMNVNVWKTSVQTYSEAIKLKAQSKSKQESQKELLRLDEWYQEDLPGVISSRSEKFITSTELVMLVQWKLSRGKFRPRLVELAGSNSGPDVEKSSRKAFEQAHKGQIESAITSLCVLRGICPATASAVLAAGCPEQAPFMADEPTVALLGQGTKLKYNLAEYLQYVEKVNTIVETLNRTGDEDVWTPHRVELALWTACIARQFDQYLFSKIVASEPSPVDKIAAQVENTSRRRKRANDQENSADSEKPLGKVKHKRVQKTS